MTTPSPSPVPADTAPLTLDDSGLVLVERRHFEAAVKVARNLAESTLVSDGGLPPLLVALGLRGRPGAQAEPPESVAELPDEFKPFLVPFNVASFGPIFEKDENVGKVVLTKMMQVAPYTRAESVDIAMSVSEGWISTPKTTNPDELADHPKPSKDPDRKEGIVISVCSRECHGMVIFELVRDAKGQPQALRPFTGELAQLSELVFHGQDGAAIKGTMGAEDSVQTRRRRSMH
jgi:hypothetical protein